MGEQKSWMGAPSPSMLVAGTALFVALGGGAYAGVALQQVKSADIKNGEVKTADLANNAVTSAKIKNGAVALADIAPAARNALRGATGAQGPRGATGDTGAPGSPGAAAGFVTDTQDFVPFPATANSFTVVASRTVPAGSYIVTATTIANNNAVGGGTVSVECRLVGGSTPFAATTSVLLAINAAAGERQTLATTGGVTLPAGGAITMQCKSEGIQGNFGYSKLTAIQVDKLTS